MISVLHVISAVLYLVAMVFGALAARNVRAVMEEIRPRVPDRFQRTTNFLGGPITEMRSGWTEFVWLPGVPVWIRQKYVSAWFYGAICAVGVASLAALWDVLPLTLLFGSAAVFMIVTVGVLMIRHRDELR